MKPTSVVIVVAALLLAVCAVSGCKTEKSGAAAASPALDDFGPVPAFELTDQHNKPVSNAVLSGHPYVVNTFFTHCRTICPPLMERLDELTGELSDPGLRFVSITVDPDNDTPTRLLEYAKEFNRLDERWHLVTGRFEAIRALVVSGFKTAVGTPPPRGTEDADITHTAKLMLVDGRGHLRGYFSTDAEGLSNLRTAIGQLGSK